MRTVARNGSTQPDAAHFGSTVPTHMEKPSSSSGQARRRKPLIQDEIIKPGTWHYWQLSSLAPSWLLVSSSTAPTTSSVGLKPAGVKANES